MPHDTNGKFKGYQAITMIGGGGFSEVYTATQTSIGREVVIKVIRPDRANQPDFIRRFETEAQIVARLEHPHITPLIDFWRDPQGAYLVMRYLRGGSIFDTIKKQGAIDPATTCHMLEQIAAALDFAHRNDVIHRDIKPGNILLDEDGNAYVADFGIAKDLTAVDPDSQTSPDAVVGSLDYIAPEQARGEPVTPRTDIYSLGVTLYEMLTGKHPFENENPLQRLYKHITDPLPQLQGLPDDVQATLNDIIQKATAKDPAKRYPDVIALAVAFREAVQARPVEGLTPREIDILLLLAERKSNHEIAQELFLSYETVRWHLGNIYKKLGVPNRSQAVKRARELGWLGADDFGDATSVLTGEFSLVEPDNPYKGLRSFNIEDARDFFGREKAVEKLLLRMAEGSRFERFLAIVGPSGSGKSSLVKAGLHSALRNGSLPGSDKWFYVSLKPQNRPLDELEIALTKLAANQGQNMRQHLERDERGLVRAAELLLPDDGSELFIIIDQFEEVFTLVENEHERQHFLNLLLSAASDARSRVRLVVTLRADYYDKPLHYPEFGEMLRTRMETILPLTATGLEQAIVRPAQRVGVNFEAGLVAQIVSEINYQAGALPLLQYALTELFEQRQGRSLTLEAYQRIGGVVGALAKGADTIYNGFDAAAQELTKQMFLRLVTLGEGAEDTRRRASLDELLSIASAPLSTSEAQWRGAGGEVNDLLNEILESFTQSRLLTLGHDDGTRQPTVEVAHEAILREWATLREWLNDSRDDIRQERIVAQATDAWQTNRRDTSYLLSGTRLEQVEKWHRSTELALTPLEHEFISTSISERTSHQKAEFERQVREKHLEQRSRNFLRGLVAVFAVATIIAASLSILAFWLNQQSRRSTAEFRSIALTFGAREAFSNGQPDTALALIHEAINIDNPPPQVEPAFFDIAGSDWIIRRFSGHHARVFDALFLPDGRRMISVGGDGRAVVWDIVTGQELQSIQNEIAFSGISWQPHGQLAALDSNSSKIVLWNLEDNTTSELSLGEVKLEKPTFSPDGFTLAAISGDTNLVYVWDIQSREVIRTFQVQADVLRMRISADSSLLGTAGTDNLSVWNFATGELLQTFAPDKGEMSAIYLFAVCFLPDGSRVLVGGTNGRVMLWNWASNTIIWETLISEEPLHVQDITLSPDGKSFAVGLNSSDLQTMTQTYDLATGQLIHSYQGHTLRVRNVDYSPDGSLLLSASDDGSAILWPVDAANTRFTAQLDADGSIVAHPNRPIAAFTEASDISGLSTIQLVDSDSGQLIRQLAGNRGEINALAFSSDGRYLLAGDYAPYLGDQWVYIWDWETGELITTLESGYKSWISALASSPDSRIIAVSEYSNATITLWEANSWELLHSLDGSSGASMALAFSPDGQYLYSGSRDGILIKWDVTSGAIVSELARISPQIIDLDVSSNGSRIVAATDEAAVVLDTLSGEELLRFNGIGSAEFSPDDSLIMTVGQSLVTLWDATTGERLQQYTEFPILDYITATFSYDGKSILAGVSNHLVSWDVVLPEGGLVQWIESNRYIPDFTCEQRELYHIEPVCEGE